MQFAYLSRSSVSASLVLLSCQVQAHQMHVSADLSWKARQGPFASKGSASHRPYLLCEMEDCKWNIVDCSPARRRLRLFYANKSGCYWVSEQRKPHWDVICEVCHVNAFIFKCNTTNGGQALTALWSKMQRKEAVNHNASSLTARLGHSGWGNNISFNLCRHAVV